MIIPGQCRLILLHAREELRIRGLSSGLRTWIWTNEAPTSKASCVNSICSVTVTGTAGLSRLVGTEPVMATAITIGLIPSLLKRLEVTDCTRCPEMLGPTRLELEPERIGASPRRLGQKHDSLVVVLKAQGILVGWARGMSSTAFSSIVDILNQ